MTDEKWIEYQEQVAEMAEKILDKEIAKGEAFSEGLCNWATHQAEQRIPRPA
jgi:hypothetical protein